MELLQEFAPIFGEPKVEWLNNGSLLLHHFLFYVHAPDPSHLRFCVTDFHSNTWEASRSILQLDDMRDDIGIGGAMSEFVNYIINSLKFGDVKLSMEGQSGKHGAAHAKLVAQKSKGMPVFSISLTKVTDSAASEAVAALSLGLFNELKNIQCLLLKEQEHSLQLKNMVLAEKEKNGSVQSQQGHYTKKQKLQNMNTSANADVSAPSLSTRLINSPGKSKVQDIGSKKVTNRIIPAFRRAKTRGALLQDSDYDKEEEQSLQPTTTISDQKEKSESIQNQQDTIKHEFQDMHTSTSANELHDSPDKHGVRGSSKVTNRVVPAHRRTKRRGALLQDFEDDSGM